MEWQAIVVCCISFILPSHVIDLCEDADRSFDFSNITTLMLHHERWLQSTLDSVIEW